MLTLPFAGLYTCSVRPRTASVLTHALSYLSLASSDLFLCISIRIAFPGFCFAVLAPFCVPALLLHRFARPSCFGTISRARIRLFASFCLPFCFVVSFCVPPCFFAHFACRFRFFCTVLRAILLSCLVSRPSCFSLALRAGFVLFASFCIPFCFIVSFCVPPYFFSLVLRTGFALSHRFACILVSRFVLRVLRRFLLHVDRIA